MQAPQMAQTAMGPQPARGTGAQQTPEWIAAAQENPQPEQTRSIRDAIYDNVIGNPNDGVQSMGESLGTWLNRAGESATLGVVGDEASAAAYSALPGRTYDGELDRFRANEEGMSTLGRLSADVAGAFAPGSLAVKAVTAPVSLGRAIATGAGLGASAGAVQGFAEGEGGLENRGGNALGGWVVGGALGGAVPAVGRAAGAVTRFFKDRSAVNATADKIARDLGISPQAARQVADAVMSDDPAIMTSNIRAAGPDAMLADAGPSVQGALDAAMQRPGAASRIGMTKIEERAAKALTRINDTLDNVLGKPQGAETAKAAVRSGTSSARSAAYDAAYSAPIDYASDAGRRLEALLPRVPGKAIRDANLLMQLDGDTSRQILAEIAEDGTVKYTRMPDVRQIDYIKRALDQAATSGDGQGALGGQTALGRAYQGLARQIRDGLKEAVPAYGQALETSADAIGRVRGIEAGYGLLKPGTTRESIKDALSNMTGPERKAAKQGVRDYLDDTLANVRAVVSDPNLDAREARKALGELTSRASKEKLSYLLRDDAPKLFSALEEAQRALGLRAAVSQNSKTAARLAYNERSKELLEPGLIRRVISGRPVQAAQGIGEAFAGTTPQAMARGADRMNAQVVETLTQPGQDAALQSMAAIQRRIAETMVDPRAGQTVRNATTALGFSGLPAATDAIRRSMGF
jgi:hypothetical protein